MSDNNINDYDKTSEEEKKVAPVMRPLRVGITHGDTNGVGYEVILKSFSEQPMFDLCIPIVFGSAKAGSFHRKALGIDTPFHIINNVEEAVEGKLNLLNCFNDEINVEFGRVSQEAGRAAFLALEAATQALKDGDIDVLVTAPICKNAIQSPDFKYAGHTEYLASRLGEGSQPLMILANDMMRVALVTTHLPISKVAEAITEESVTEKIEQLYASLRHDFLISSPRIAVLGLNPHNGDGGLMGSEEQEAIVPAIKKCVEAGIQCFGPYAADGFFGAGMYGHFDAVLAMYHDQGLAAFKALSMDNGVNITAGLPFVRTSPDHGTAFDIAGQNKASEASFRQAIYTAIDIFRSREADDEANENPLPKLYHERREDGNRNRHLQPAAPSEEKPAKQVDDKQTDE